MVDPGFGQGRGQPAKEGPQALAGPSSCDGPSRFEGQRGRFEASDAHRAHYELKRLLGAAKRASSDAQRAPYELKGSLRRSVNPFRGHQSTC